MRMILSLNGEENGDIASVFNDNLHLSSAMILIVVIVTFCTGWLQNTIESKYEQSAEVTALIEHIYKEMAVTGCISFLMFIVETTGALNVLSQAVQMNYHTMILIFEYAHMALVCAVILYVSLACLILSFLQHLSQNWSECNSLSTIECIEAHLSILNHTSNHQRYPHFVQVYNSMIKLEFQYVKFEFMKQFVTDKRLMKHFDFLLYLKMALYEVCLELVDVTWPSAALAITLVLLRWLEKAILSPTPLNIVEVLQILIWSWGSMLTVFYLYFNLSYIMREHIVDNRMFSKQRLMAWCDLNKKSTNQSRWPNKVWPSQYENSLNGRLSCSDLDIAGQKVSYNDTQTHTNQTANSVSTKITPNKKIFPDTFNQAKDTNAKFLQVDLKRKRESNDNKKINGAAQKYQIDYGLHKNNTKNQPDTESQLFHEVSKSTIKKNTSNLIVRSVSIVKENESHCGHSGYRKHFEEKLKKKESMILREVVSRQKEANISPISEVIQRDVPAHDDSKFISRSFETRDTMASKFLRGKPKFTLHLLQLVLMGGVFFFGIMATDEFLISHLYLLISAFIPVLVTLFVLPIVIRKYTMVTSLGSLARVGLIVLALHKSAEEMNKKLDENEEENNTDSSNSPSDVEQDINQLSRKKNYSKLSELCRECSQSSLRAHNVKKIQRSKSTSDLCTSSDQKTMLRVQALLDSGLHANEDLQRKSFEQHCIAISVPKEVSDTVQHHIQDRFGVCGTNQLIDKSKCEGKKDSLPHQSRANSFCSSVSRQALRTTNSSHTGRHSSAGNIFNHTLDIGNGRPSFLEQNQGLLKKDSPS